MTRYRALTFGKPLAPWQATKELAEQAAIEAEEASRDPQTRFVYLGTGVTIEQDDGDPPPMTPDMELWATALSILRTHLFGAEDYIDALLETASGDREAEARWRLIAKRIAMLRTAAERDESTGESS